MHCGSSHCAMADCEADGQQELGYKWTDADTERLIKWRATNDCRFTGKRNAAMTGFEMFIKEHGLEGKVKPGWTKKKWENLKQKYKEVKASRTGVKTEGGEATFVNWKWYHAMEEMLEQKSSVTPASFILSAMAPIKSEDLQMLTSSVQAQYSSLLTVQDAGKKKGPMARQRMIEKSCKLLEEHINQCSIENNLDDLLKGSETESRLPSQDRDGEESPSHTETSSVSPPPKKRAKTKNKFDADTQKLVWLHMLDIIKETNKEPELDCEDSFGVTVAMELKRIRSSVLRNSVKRQIMTVLYDALDCEQTDTLLYQPLPTSPREESHSITVVLP
ncbi:uncharacterized protein LOC128381773 [Scomber japonicus]|uniref:uncharacterized protein LOC128381773 n=1 Tax=Scomber japonicus TaxID=13676 RepID=UPI002305A47D|nr:uncharacterized protein LOC128381773 [Scomber japonicus]